MAITVVHQPDEVSLSKGRISYGLQGTGPVITGGVKALNNLIFFNPPQNGDVLTLTWKGQSIRFTFRTIPDAPTDLPLGPKTNAYLATLIPKFQDLQAIDEDFIAYIPDDSSTYPYIRLEARQPGTAYTLTQYWTGGPEFSDIRTMVFPFEPGVDPTYRPNYGIYLEVWCQKPGSIQYTRLCQDIVDADDTGYAEIPISDYLHTHLASDWPPLANPIPETFLALSSHRSYYVRYAEAWGEPQQVFHLTKSPVRQVYFGGVDVERKSDFSLYSLVRSSSLPSEDRALRYGPEWRFVRPDEPQYLSFLALRNDLPELLVEFNLEYDNGSRRAVVDLIPPVNVAKFSKLIVPVGMLQVDMARAIPEGVRVVSYTVRLLNQAGYQSRPYQYIVDYQHQPYRRHFTYLNSLGCPETLTVFGKGSPELKIFSAQAERVRKDDDPATVSQFVEYDLQQQQQFEVATGWITGSQQELMRDFYRSPEKFQYWPLRVLPIRVTSTAVRQQKDGDNQVAHKFEYEFQFRDSFYSEDLDGEEEPLPVPPPGFQGGSDVTVVVQPKQFAFDPTISNLIRNLTGVDINKFFQAYAWGNHAQAGYLTQNTGAALFAGKVHLHGWKDLQDVPPVLESGISLDMTKFPKRGVMTVTASVDGKPFQLESALKNRIKIRKK